MIAHAIRCVNDELLVASGGGEVGVDLAALGVEGRDREGAEAGRGRHLERLVHVLGEHRVRALEQLALVAGGRRAAAALGAPPLPDALPATSLLVIMPAGPLPVTPARSTPLAAARRRATGVAGGPPAASAGRAACAPSPSVRPARRRRLRPGWPTPGADGQVTDRVGDLEGLALGHDDLLQDAGHRRGNGRVDLVGRDLAEVLVLGDRVAGLLVPLDDRCPRRPIPSRAARPRTGPRRRCGGRGGDRGRGGLGRGGRGRAAGAAAAGAGAAGAGVALGSLEISASADPTSTVSPSAARSATTTPPKGAGTSTSTLSVVRSSRMSPVEMVSPTATRHSTMVPSVTDSPSSGRITCWVSDVVDTRRSNMSSCSFAKVRPHDCYEHFRRNPAQSMMPIIRGGCPAGRSPDDAVSAGQASPISGGGTCSP